MESVNKAVVVYHANCVDGFASAWAFHVLKEKEYSEVAYVACSYSNESTPIGLNQDQIFDRDVYILDFSWGRVPLSLICKTANKVLVLDHHKTAAEALCNWEDQPENLEIVFDMERSGCGITWDYFACLTNELRPVFLNYIEDRDLWKFKLEESKAVNALIAVSAHTFEAYDCLRWALDKNLSDVRFAGRSLNKWHDKISSEISLDARPITISNGLGESWNGLASNCTPQFSSEVGNLLAHRSGTFGATYHSQKDGLVKWSIRSIGDYDVSAIAKLFGGGGHRNAAGFVVRLNGVEGQDARHIYLWTYPMGSEDVNTGKIL